MYQNSRLRPQPKPKKMRSPKGLFVAALLLIIAIIVAGVFFVGHDDQSSADKKTEQTQQAPGFDKTRLSHDDPASLWVVVNKKRPLSPKAYVPATLKAPAAMRLSGQPTQEAMQMNQTAADALDAMDTDARAHNIQLKVVSAYRSYAYQQVVYDSEVRGYGQAEADRESARPGYSEHQTGWAIDLGAVNGKCQIETCFADTPEGKWLAANAHTYGFVIRYAKDKESVTGYKYEPWHIRFVGVELAAEMHKRGMQTLEEFLDLSPAPSY